MSGVRFLVQGFTLPSNNHSSGVKYAVELDRSRRKAPRAVVSAALLQKQEL